MSITTAVAKKEKKVSEAEKLLIPYKEAIGLALPKSYTPERFLRILQSVINSQPALLKDKASLIGALFTCAQLGLEPNTYGMCYIIPYSGKAEFQLGYRGILELARRSNEIADIYAEVVHEKDTFKVQAGLDRNIIHEIDYTEDRGNVIAVYSVALFKDGTRHFEVMSKSDVEGIRLGAPSKNSPAWKNHWGEMAKKVVIKRMCKMLPISPDDRRGIETDEKVREVDLEELKAGKVEDMTLPQEQDNNDFIDINPEDKPATKEEF